MAQLHQTSWLPFFGESRSTLLKILAALSGGMLTPLAYLRAQRTYYLLSKCTFEPFLIRITLLSEPRSGW